MSDYCVLNLPGAIEEDLRNLEDCVARFKDGSLDADGFRAFRVPQGVYEERTDGNYMMRLRLPAGAALPHQLRALASATRKYGRDLLHLTTRQDIQIHSVPVDGIHPALAELYGAGLSSKGGGGNTVRNIAACPHAGVCPKESFDVTPHVVSLSEFLLSDPSSFTLPRKYKIALSGCSADCAGATVNDLGLIAKCVGGQTGFAVYIAGGMGGHPRVAEILEEFVRPEEICYIAEAIKRVFDEHGNRENRRRARLRFLLSEIGLEGFRELYEVQLARLKSEAPPVPAVRDVTPADRPAAPESASPLDGFDSWREINVEAQWQDEFFIVHVPLVLGDITTSELDGLADVVAEHGEGMVRATQSQDLVIRWVAEEELTSVHAKLAPLGLADRPAPILRNTVSCTGASTCRLGICLSRGLAGALIEKLQASSIDLASLGDLRVFISGCPNSCGRHPIADIGLFGAARRVGGLPVPHYILQLGGRTDEGTARLAEGKSSIPARRVPEVIEKLLEAFSESPTFPDFDAFVDGDGREIADRLAAEHKEVPPFDEDKSLYFDWGSETQFSLAGRK